MRRVVSSAVEAGLVPIKEFAHAKRRLSEHFDDGERLQIVAALVDDAIDLCAAVGELSWWVVTSEPEAARRATERGLDCLPDPGRGLNEALVAAIATIASQGATAVTVIPCDIPLARPGDLRDLLDTGATSDMVVVPSTDGGTNALYLRPPQLSPPRFGKTSFRAHLAAAERLHCRCAILNLPRLALDIDTLGDVDAFLERSQQESNATRRVLARLRPG